MQNYQSEIDYFRNLILNMPDDVDDIWPLMDSGNVVVYKKPVGTNEYQDVYLPGVGSDQRRFMDVSWHGTWESLVDIQTKKAKKLKFLNEIDNIKNRYLMMLDFMEKFGPRHTYRAKTDPENLPEETFMKTLDSSR